MSFEKPPLSVCFLKVIITSNNKPMLKLRYFVVYDVDMTVNKKKILQGCEFSYNVEIMKQTKEFNYIN